MQGKTVVIGLILFVIGLVIGASPIVQGVSKETLTITKSLLVTKTIVVTEKPITNWFVCFSPKANCSNLLIYWISKANRSIHIMIYSFTLDEIANALINARNKGLDVKVIVEERQVNVRGSEFERLKKNGIDVRVDGNPALMHNKVAIIDGYVVITGSYNYSYAAENRNDENLIVLLNKELASLYEKRFKVIWSKSKQ